MNEPKEHERHDLPSPGNLNAETLKAELKRIRGLAEEDFNSSALRNQLESLNTAELTRDLGEKIGVLTWYCLVEKNRRLKKNASKAFILGVNRLKDISDKERELYINWRDHADLDIKSGIKSARKIQDQENDKEALEMYYKLIKNEFKEAG